MRAIKGTDNSRQKVVNELKSEIGLVDLLFRELALYKQACVCRRAEILSAAAETGIALLVLALSLAIGS
jgi:hypothetical protein